MTTVKILNANVTTAKLAANAVDTTKLAADAVATAQILKANDLKPVTLARAMTDPAYAMAEDAVGANGNQWVSRWALSLHKDMPWKTLPVPPAEIKAMDDRLQGAAGPPAAASKPVG